MPQQIDLPEFKIQNLSITLVGDTPLIVHAWSHKAKQEMLDNQMKKAKQAKSAKDPWMDYCESLYWMDGMPSKPEQKHIDAARFGFPTVAFKAAAVRAANDAGMKMTEARRTFHIDGEFIRINGTPRMREDMVTVGMGKADIRYRGEFPVWSAEMLIKFNSHVISAEQIINLFEIAGFGVGIGEWRPEKNGNFGRFHVAREGEI